MNSESAPPAGKRADLLAGCAVGLFVLYIAQLLIGGLLELKYSATEATAYRDTLAIQASMGIVRAFHYWSSSLLIAGCIATVVAMLFAKWFNGGHNRAWLGVVLLFLASLVGQISGNVLPFDRHGVETATVESGVARQAPVLGPSVARAILGGEQFNAGTVRIWHAAHIGFLVLGLIAGWMIWSGLRSQEKSRPAMWAPLGIAGLLMLLVKAPLGSAATPADYGAFDAQVSWYTWPLHGSLNLFNKISPNMGWIGSMVLPGLFAGFLVLAPWLSKRLKPGAVQGITIGFGAYFLIAALLFGGAFAPLVGDRDPTPIAAIPHNAGAGDPVLYAKGRDLFNSNGCSGCHGKDGRIAGVGPNLLGVASRRGTDPAWYTAFIHDPKSKKPNSTMPAFSDIKPDDLRAIAEFLIHQK